MGVAMSFQLTDLGWFHSTLLVEGKFGFLSPKFFVFVTASALPFGTISPRVQYTN
jgi:hypothetical protein